MERGHYNGILENGQGGGWRKKWDGDICFTFDWYINNMSLCWIQRYSNRGLGHIYSNFGLLKRHKGKVGTFEKGKHILLTSYEIFEKFEQGFGVLGKFLNYN